VRPLLLIAANDVRLTVRDRAAAFWMFVLPIFLIWLFGSVGGGDKAPKVALTVIDRDGGWLARSFAKELDAPNVALVVLSGADTAGEKAKSATRWIELPAGFTDNVLAGKQQRLKIETGENADSDYSRAGEVVTIRAIVRTLARVAELKQQSGAPPTANAYDALRARPPIVSLESSSAGRGTAVPRGVAQSVPGIMTFTVLMMTLIYGAVFLTIEKREGVLKRQMTLPVSRTTIMAGKILGRVFIAMLQIAILVAAGRFLFRLDFGHAPAALFALLLAYAGAVAGIATFLGAVLANPEQASIVGWLASMVMAALGGCWWPSEVMPEWLRTMSHVFPTTWAMDGLHALISFGRGFEAVVLPSAVLLALGAAFAWIGARKLRTAE